tara:strand:+ start:3307 stop:3540 length:234 start_codon:yes stop_codon:yes gene_type:complete
MKDFKVYSFAMLLLFGAVAVGGAIMAIVGSLIGPESSVTSILLKTISGIGAFICVLYIASRFNKPFNDFWDKVYNSK